MKAFEKALSTVLWFETGGRFDPKIPGCLDGSDKIRCGYVNDPSDRGGETKYGISASAHPELDIANLDFATVSSVYFSSYWVPAGCDKFSERVAAYVFDVSVNSGVREGDKLLQMALNIAADGVVGPQTISTELKQASVDEGLILSRLVSLRSNFYTMIVSAHPSDIKFLRGWVNRANTFMLHYDTY